MSASSLLLSFGYLGMFLVLFAETSLLTGLFLPGDTLLFAAGILAYLHYFSLAGVIVIGAAAGIAGDAVGYWIGRRYGEKFFHRERSRVFSAERLAQAKLFFEKHGGKAVLFARFFPFIRTAAPIMSGASRMNYVRFTIYNIVGASVWSASFTILGYFLGRAIPRLDHYVGWGMGALLVTAVIVASARFAYRHARHGEHGRSFAN